jgi:hypothetical protein
MKKLILIYFICVLLISFSSAFTWYNPFTWFGGNHIIEDVIISDSHSFYSENRETIINKDGFVSMLKDDSLILTIDTPDIYSNTVQTGKTPKDLIQKKSGMLVKSVSDISLVYEKVLSPFGNDAIKYDVILDKKPTTNIINFPIYYEDLVFHYQPALNSSGQNNCNETFCWDNDFNIIDSRPEEVVGSYAVYHSFKKNNKYGSGKVMHIYRPLIIDSNGDEIWGVMNIQGSTLSVTIDQEWLDNAKYPVYVDPMLGYDTAGSSFVGVAYNIFGSYWYNSSADSEVFNMTAHVRGNHNANWYFAYAIYEDDGGDYVLVDNATTNNYTVTTGISASWITLDFPNNPILADGGSYLFATGNTGTSQLGRFLEVAYDTNSAYQTLLGDYSSGFESPLTVYSDPAYTDRILSIYVNYELIVTGSCTYSGSGNWEINCNDNCTVSSNVNLLGNNISIIGDGVTKINSNITNFSRSHIRGSLGICHVICENGGCLK